MKAQTALLVSVSEADSMNVRYSGEPVQGGFAAMLEMWEDIRVSAPDKHELVSAGPQQPPEMLSGVRLEPRLGKLSLL